MYSDIPTPFIEAAIYSISACCFGRFFVIPKSRNKRPNLYIILSSAPGIGRRGDMLNYINQVKFSAIERYCEERKNSDVENEMQTQILEGGSPQGLADDIIYHRKKGLNSYCLSSTEFGRILDSIKHGQGYMTLFDSLLCKLWSGEPYYESFSKKGGNESRYVKPGTYFNICSTSQKIKLYLDDKMSQTGLCRRLLVASVEGTDIDFTKYKAPMGYDTEKMVEDLKDFGSKIGAAMLGYHNRANGKIIELPCSSESLDKINKYAEPWAKKVLEDDENPYFLYQQTRWEYVLKVAANIALLQGKRTIAIEQVDAAITFVDNCTKDIRTILERSQIPTKMKDQENHLNRICDYFKKGLTQREVQSRMSGYGVHAQKHEDIPGFNEYMKILLEDGRITMKDNEGRFNVL